MPPKILRSFIVNNSEMQRLACMKTTFILVVLYMVFGFFAFKSENDQPEGKRKEAQVPRHHALVSGQARQ